MNRAIRMLIVGFGLIFLSAGVYYVADQRIDDLEEDYNRCTERDDADYEECYRRYDSAMATQVRLTSLTGAVIGIAIAGLAWPLAAPGKSSGPGPVAFSNGQAEALELRRRGALTEQEFSVVRSRLGF